MREPKYITASEMEEHLRDAFARDPETSFLGVVTRGLRDPAVPETANRRPRLHPLWLTLGLAAVGVLGIFVYFSFVRS